MWGRDEDENRTRFGGAEPDDFEDAAFSPSASRWKSWLEVLAESLREGLGYQIFIE